MPRHALTPLMHEDTQVGYVLACPRCAEPIELPINGMAGDAIFTDDVNRRFHTGWYEAAEIDRDRLTIVRPGHSGRDPLRLSCQQPGCGWTGTIEDGKAVTFTG